MAHMLKRKLPSRGVEDLSCKLSCYLQEVYGLCRCANQDWLEKVSFRQIKVDLIDLGCGELRLHDNSIEHGSIAASLVVACAIVACLAAAQ